MRTLVYFLIYPALSPVMVADVERILGTILSAHGARPDTLATIQGLDEIQALIHKMPKYANFDWLKEMPSILLQDGR
jgi:hypothetical protein